MKKRLLLITALSFVAIAGTFAQCNGRYQNETFPTVTTTSNITFGSNLDMNGNTVTLSLDFYEPAADTLTQRPLIVWIHGGSFIGGTKNDPDVTALSQRFAKRGYVCCSINYRLGITIPPNQTTATAAVVRAVQDAKAAVRFFRENATTYGIDTAQVFMGGSSAGAFTALHAAYLNKPSEIPSWVDTVALGNLEGNSGHPGFSSDFRACVNLCGALGDAAWLEPHDKPLCSMHGTADNTVPYNTAIIYLSGVFPIMQVYGSWSIDSAAQTNGTESWLHLWYGQDHVPYVASQAYMDSTVTYVADFLYRHLDCYPAGIADIKNNEMSIDIFPIPTFNSLTVSLSNTGNLPYSYEIIDHLGRVVEKAENQTGRNFQINRKGFSSGIYCLNLTNSKGRSTKKFIFN